MVNLVKIIKLLNEKNIMAILIGGLAMRMHNSPRATNDIDLAVRSLDVDDIVEIMYTHEYYLITEVNNDTAGLMLSVEDALKWIETSKSGSMTFIRISMKGEPIPAVYPLEKIDISTQVDFLFELGIPVMKLKQNALVNIIDGIEILFASKEDLLILKENRKQKIPADYADIEFLKAALKPTS